MAEIAVTSFYHTVEIEQVIYGSLDEAITQMFHHSQCAASGIAFPPLSSIYCISETMILSPSSNTEVGSSSSSSPSSEHPLSKSETVFRGPDGEWQWDGAYRIGPKFQAFS